MSRQAIFSMPLSFAIVLVAAIALSGPGPAPDPGLEVATGPTESGPQPSGTIAAAGGTVPAGDPAPIAPPEPVSGPVTGEGDGPVAEREAVADPEPVAVAPSPEGQPDPPAEPEVPVPDPSDAVLVGRPTVVASEPGETIADVSARVFGTTDMAGPLLDLNAGTITDPHRPLPEGTFLRLP